MLSLSLKGRLIFIDRMNQNVVSQYCQRVTISIIYYVCVQTCGSQKKLQAVGSLYHVGPQDQGQLVALGGSPFYQYAELSLYPSQQLLIAVKSRLAKEVEAQLSPLVISSEGNREPLLTNTLVTSITGLQVFLVFEKRLL